MTDPSHVPWTDVRGEVDPETQLLAAVLNEEPCGDPACCPPRDPRSYRVFKAAVAVTIAGIFLLVLKALVFG